MSTPDTAGRVFDYTPPLDGSSVASFQIPFGYVLDVESVVVFCDTSAAGVRPELTVQAPSGAVIAKKRQVEVIPIGSDGYATWALRLSDDGAGAGGVVAPNMDVFFQMGAAGPPLPIAEATAVFDPAQSGTAPVAVSLSLTSHLAAATQLAVSVYNRSAAATPFFLALAYVQRLDAAGRDILSGNQVVIPAAGADTLTWDTQDGPDALLDLLVPGAPTIINTGDYAVTVIAKSA